MPARTIPQTVEFTCDCCAAQATEAKARLPKDWMRLHMECNGSRLSYPQEPLDKVLCPDCGERTIKAIEHVEPAPKVTP
jgi:Zn finger protein HypA/HybF involved in hydrogenase expression